MQVKGKLSERGSETPEFAIALPLLIILLFAIGAFAWAFWTQQVADLITFNALKESTINRGNSIVVNFGQAYYQNNLSALSNPKSAGEIGNLQVSPLYPFRVVSFKINSSDILSLGDFQAAFKWGGGGLSRIWEFFGGPPDIWE